jgi:hypothetical protein
LTLAFPLAFSGAALAADSDGDGLDDAVELSVYKTDPLDADMDDDGLGDGMVHDTDPLDPDTDASGTPDGVEIDRGGDPLDPSDDGPWGADSGGKRGGTPGGCGWDASPGEDGAWWWVMRPLGVFARS